MHYKKNLYEDLYHSVLMQIYPFGNPLLRFRAHELPSTSYLEGYQDISDGFLVIKVAHLCIEHSMPCLFHFCSLVQIIQGNYDNYLIFTMSIYTLGISCQIPI